MSKPLEPTKKPVPFNRHIKSKMARLVLYTIYRHFGVPSGIEVKVNPSTNSGWPNITFKKLPMAHLGMGKNIRDQLYSRQSDPTGNLTLQTMDLFEECLKELKPKMVITYPALAVKVVQNYLPALLNKLSSSSEVRVAAICRSPVVYYMGKKLENNRVKHFLTQSEDAHGKLMVVDLLSGRRYLPEDLLLEPPLKES